MHFSLKFVLCGNSCCVVSQPALGQKIISVHCGKWANVRRTSSRPIDKFTLDHTSGKKCLFCCLYNSLVDHKEIHDTFLLVINWRSIYQTKLCPRHIRESISVICRNASRIIERRWSSKCYEKPSSEPSKYNFRKFLKLKFMFSLQRDVWSVRFTHTWLQNPQCETMVTR